MTRKLGRIVFILITVLIVLGVVLSAVGVSLARRSFPKIDGELTLPGLDGVVDIYRDTYGIPHIYAVTEHDLFFAQGYVHAQDRFWQMDFWRHLGSGRLSEMFGEGQLETDVFLRTLGWARVAQQELAELDAESLAVLQAYTQGVNAYLADHQGAAISLEYAVLGVLTPGYAPESWSPLHSLTWAKAMAWDLRGNMDEEIERALLLKILSAEQVAELYPAYPEGRPVIVGTAVSTTSDASISSSIHAAGLPSEAFSALLGRFKALDALIGPFGAGIGSNSWVLAGSRTATGTPLLANDPHLGIQMPSIWYEIGLHCTVRGPDCRLDVTGYSFASTPGVIIGHNDRIAWGFTNVGPDVMDLYVEKINPQNPNQYEYNGEWVDMTLVKETIQVAAGDPVEITVRYTRHGPVLWDTPEALQEFQASAGIDLPSDYVLSLRWTALDVSHTFPAIWRLDLAQNWEQFRLAAAMFDVPAQNLIYADVEGNIGYQMPGRIPIRGAGQNGVLPTPGWSEAYEWQGYIPFEALPFVFNPPQGYVVTANNAVVGADYPYLISSSWDYGLRAARIVEMIESAPGPIDMAMIQQMQGDNKDLNAQALVPQLLAVALDDARLEAGRELLIDWDYQARMESAPAALFNAFWRHLLARIFHDDLPEAHWPYGGSRWAEVVRQLNTRPDSPWWDDRQTAQAETRAEIYRLAFAAAVDELEALQGNDPARWRWGELHTATFENATLGGAASPGPIRALFNRGPFPTSGGDAIVNATGWSMSEPYTVDWLPSMRMIVDIGDLTNALAVNTTGQSGHAYHPHYIDQADLWRNIQYHPQLWERAEIERRAEGHLRLRP